MHMSRDVPPLLNRTIYSGMAKDLVDCRPTSGSSNSLSAQPSATIRTDSDPSESPEQITTDDDELGFNSGSEYVEWDRIAYERERKRQPLNKFQDTSPSKNSSSLALHPTASDEKSLSSCWKRADLSVTQFLKAQDEAAEQNKESSKQLKEKVSKRNFFHNAEAQSRCYSIVDHGKRVSCVSSGNSEKAKYANRPITKEQLTEKIPQSTVPPTSAQKTSDVFKYREICENFLNQYKTLEDANTMQYRTNLKTDSEANKRTKRTERWVSQFGEPDANENLNSGVQSEDIKGPRGSINTGEYERGDTSESAARSPTKNIVNYNTIIQEQLALMAKDSECIMEDSNGISGHKIQMAMKRALKEAGKLLIKERFLQNCRSQSQMCDCKEDLVADAQDREQSNEEKPKNVEKLFQRCPRHRCKKSNFITEFKKIIQASRNQEKSCDFSETAASASGSDGFQPNKKYDSSSGYKLRSSSTGYSSTESKNVSNSTHFTPEGTYFRHHSSCIHHRTYKDSANSPINIKRMHQMNILKASSRARNTEKCSNSTINGVISNYTDSHRSSKNNEQEMNTKRSPLELKDGRKAWGEANRLSSNKNKVGRLEKKASQDEATMETPDVHQGSCIQKTDLSTSASLKICKKRGSEPAHRFTNEDQSNSSCSRDVLSHSIDGESELQSYKSKGSVMQDAETNLPDLGISSSKESKKHERRCSCSKKLPTSFIGGENEPQIKLKGSPAKVKKEEYKERAEKKDSHKTEELERYNLKDRFETPSQDNNLYDAVESKIQKSKNNSTGTSSSPRPKKLRDKWVDMNYKSIAESRKICACNLKRVANANDDGSELEKRLNDKVYIEEMTGRLSANQYVTNDKMKNTNQDHGQIFKLGADADSLDMSFSDDKESMQYHERSSRSEKLCEKCRRIGGTNRSNFSSYDKMPSTHNEKMTELSMKAEEKSLKGKKEKAPTMSAKDYNLYADRELLSELQSFTVMLDSDSQGKKRGPKWIQTTTKNRRNCSCCALSSSKRSESEMDSELKSSVLDSTRGMQMSSKEVRKASSKKDRLETITKNEDIYDTEEAVIGADEDYQGYNEKLDSDEDNYYHSNDEDSTQAKITPASSIAGKKRGSQLASTKNQANPTCEEKDCEIEKKVNKLFAITEEKIISSNDPIVGSLSKKEFQTTEAVETLKQAKEEKTVPKNALGLNIINADEALLDIPEDFQGYAVMLDSDADMLDLSISDDEEQIKAKLTAAALTTGKKNGTKVTRNVSKYKYVPSEEEPLKSRTYVPLEIFYRRTEVNRSELLLCDGTDDPIDETEPTNYREYVYQLAERTLRACVKVYTNKHDELRRESRFRESPPYSCQWPTNPKSESDRNEEAKVFGQKLNKQLKQLNHDFQEGLQSIGK
ncbi:uncharacterized protein LOC115623644 [Scaptodrosophila lebanonensis]|uniref:Uncharacterized protein LOC115623644 n=1 Tax=Drosophila lebanonensis TaxID=7225 RepID=A0A6J2TD76_DROLE|nr:uncharacterized protein LOC115623644 [Scaptodrosophila lebanonensis]